MYVPNASCGHPVASPGDPPRPAGRADPGSYQISAFALGLHACEISCASFKRDVFVSPSPVGLLKVSSAAFASHLSEWPSSKTTQIRNGEDVEKQETLYTVGWNVNCLFQPLWKTVWRFLKKLKMKL